MIKLSQRLQNICDIVPCGARICDVGCDHAYVDIRLLQEGKVTHALAMDVADGPLATARSNLELTELLLPEQDSCLDSCAAESDCSDFGDHAAAEREDAFCELRKSDGLAAYIPGEADVMICAGMGGILMRSLLEAEPEKALSFREMILSPHREVHLVREWLFANDCVIAEERFFQDEGKYYTVLRALCPQENGVQPLQKRPDWDELADQVRKLPEETLQRAMVKREQLCRILEDKSFRKTAEAAFGPCVLAEYLSNRSEGESSHCFDRYVREKLQGKLRLLQKLAESPTGENTGNRLQELSGEIGELQVMLAVHRLLA
jgi:tRNA (adenine22-N1)-methyltransferase